jgi:hypothetical protein
MAEFLLGPFDVRVSGVVRLYGEAARLVSRVDGLGAEAFGSEPTVEGSRSGLIGVIANPRSTKWV